MYCAVAASPRLESKLQAETGSAAVLGRNPHNRQIWKSSYAHSAGKSGVVFSSPKVSPYIGKDNPP